MEERSKDEFYELFEKNALGNIASQLYPGYGDFYSVPLAANQESFELLSVFTKRDRSTFEYAGSLRINGGILEENGDDLLHSLKPHLHSSSKQYLDRSLIALKRPFSSGITEFSARDWTSITSLDFGRDGKFFSWLDMGFAQIEYVDPQKLTARVNNLRVRREDRELDGKPCIYVVYKVWYSERLCYYPSKQLFPSKHCIDDREAWEQQIKNTTKCLDRLCINVSAAGARAFSVCRVPLSLDGSLGVPYYDVKLVPTNPHLQDFDTRTFHAEELDFGFIHWLASRVRSMTTKRFWQPALRSLFSFPSQEDTRIGLEFLLDTVRNFQTEEKCVILLVDFSSAIHNTPSCLRSRPSILASFLRGAAIILTQRQKYVDSDDDEDDFWEEQVVFKPENCQEHLRVLEALFTLLVKGVITAEQGRSVSQLNASEVVSLQELFYTQMKCICSPWKSLNLNENPLSKLWRKPSRTRTFLESIGLKETRQGGQLVAICPENCQLLNVLSLFHDKVD